MGWELVGGVEWGVSQVMLRMGPGWLGGWWGPPLRWAQSRTGRRVTCGTGGGKEEKVSFQASVSSHSVISRQGLWGSGQQHTCP